MMQLARHFQAKKEEEKEERATINVM